MSAKDPHDLARFVTAQQRHFDSAIKELERGRKSGHWIWFVFPQVAGLGFSSLSRRYAIRSLDEARAYLKHPVLGQRLMRCVHLVLDVDGKSAVQILGHVDALKFRSCLTLFAAADSDNTLFMAALDKYYDGIRDPLTLEKLATI
jgi:uncharacterized protein (DUF1810 family)